MKERVMKSMFVGAMLLLVMRTGSCTSNDATEGAPLGHGVVHKGVGPECPETWRIDTADGRMLWPVEKPEFQVEGLRVRFTAREREGMSICMAGTMVEVITIEKE